MDEDDPKPFEPPQPIPLGPPAGVKVRLTPDELTDVTDHINRMAVSPNDACPVCGSPLNSVNPDVYQVGVLMSSPALGYEFQPLVSTICTNCGFVRFFNQIVVNELIQGHKAAVKSSSEAEDTSGS